MHVSRSGRIGDAPTSAASTPVEPRSFERGAIVLLVTFLLIFPKGGIKVAEVPITWGYLLLGIASLSIPLALLSRSRARVRKESLTVVAGLIPFQMVVWLGLLFNGVTGMGFAISLLVSFFFVPLAFLLALGPSLDRLNLGLLYRLIRGGILFIAAYGIFLFFYRLGTGSFIEIPYLTVNAGDFGDMDEKFIDRGGIFKLISTYNNGNIYGVSLLLLLPLYSWLERRTWPKLIVKLSLLLTLSRTVWVGLLVYEVVQRIYVRRISVKDVALLLVSLVLLVAGVLAALTLMGAETSFLFDPNLGGRIGQLEVLRNPSILPSISFEHVLEMVYLSMLENFGLVGLLSYVLAMTMPLWLLFLGAVPFAETEYKRGLGAGLIVYLFVSLSDGALLFIPVMAFYWFIVALLVSPNPSFTTWGEAGVSARSSSNHTRAVPPRTHAGHPATAPDRPL
ncbi:MAG: hypothetical protein WD766_08960 [Gemmatimonadota bacterium]